MTLSIESEPVWCKEYSNDTNVVWYFSNIDNKLTGDTRHLLETYSNIPKDEVLRHINTIVRNFNQLAVSQILTFKTRSAKRHGQSDLICAPVKECSSTPLCPVILFTTAFYHV